MRRFFFTLAVFTFWVSLFGYFPAQAQEVAEEQVKIENPIEGAVVQGLVPIIISSNLAASINSELSFTYHQNETDTWFVIWEGAEELSDGELAVWDTTTITDGNYDMRLLVWISENEQTEFIVPEIRVRNYSPIETNTPGPQSSVTPKQTILASATPIPSTKVVPLANATPEPNPASLEQDQILQVVLRSSVGVIVVFLLAGGYFFLRSLLRSRR